MRVRRKRRDQGSSEELELNMNPLIDIVFNLLIFFLCATKFRTAEGAIEAYLPRDRGGGTGPSQAVHDVRIKLLWLTTTGRATQGSAGRVVVKVGQRALNQPGALERLRDPTSASVWWELRSLLQELKSQHRGNQPLPVIIDARPQVPHQYVVSALNEVVRAEIRNVTFARPER